MRALRPARAKSRFCRLVLPAALFVLVVLLLAACAAPAPTAAPPTPAPQITQGPAATSAPSGSGAKLERNIKVGVIDAYSGPAAVYGEDALNGFKLALDEINKDGVLGAKIEFTQRDSKFKPDVALSMAKELVMQDKVDLLAGTINSAAALAVSAYAKEQKIPFIVWSAKSDNITGKQGHRYVFSTSDNTTMGGKAGAQFLAKKPYVKYWIAGDDYEYGHAIADAAWNTLKTLKPDVTLAGQTWWKVGEPDLIPYITQIMAAKPDAVIIATGGASTPNALKAAKTTGLAEKIPVWMHASTDYTSLKALGENAPEGVMGTNDYYFYYPETPANQAFVTAYHDRYGTYPGFAAYHAYMTAHFIADAYKKAGTLDKEKFTDALEGLTINGPTGEVQMRACDHQAILSEFMGVTKKVSKYNFLIASDIVTIPGKDIVPTCAEIQKLRTP